MKQQVPFSAIIAVAVLLIGGIGFFVWKSFLAPRPVEKPFAPKIERPATAPTTREEGLKMMQSGGKKPQ